MKTKLICAIIIVFTFSCVQDSSFEAPIESQEIHPRFNKTEGMEGFSMTRSTAKSASAAQFMSDVNTALENQGLSIRLNQVEYYGSDGAGNTVFFDNRGNKQLDADFVPGDARRGGFTDIAYARDGTEGATSSGLTQAQTDGAILNAMNTWDNISCSQGLVLTNIGSSPFDLGYVEALVTGGAEGDFFFTDLMHSGFNTTVTDAVFGPGSNVLGVTFTFLWTDASGFTDIDNNNKLDVAFRDIYYNDSFSWAIGNNIDVETVALHEAGHGLSQAHFGKLFTSNGNGNFHFAPRAVMNAGYTGVQTTIGATDNAGHCSNWGQWPNN